MPRQGFIKVAANISKKYLTKFGSRSETNLLYSVLRVHENVTLKREESKGCGLRKRFKAQPVPMTTRIHLFPCRTQKLSSFVPKILGWRRPGKIGRCRLSLLLYAPLAQLVEQLTLNQRALGSSPRWCTRKRPLQKSGLFSFIVPFVCKKPLGDNTL